MNNIHDTMPTKTNLREYLDPTGVNVLKKRLIAGQITPVVFKETLKRQMVSQFFQDYTHPVDRAWEKMTKILTRERSLIRRRQEEAHHAENGIQIDWGQPFPLPPSKKPE